MRSWSRKRESGFGSLAPGRPFSAPGLSPKTPLQNKVKVVYPLSDSHELRLSSWPRSILILWGILSLSASASLFLEHGVRGKKVLSSQASPPLLPARMLPNLVSYFLASCLSPVRKLTRKKLTYDLVELLRSPTRLSQPMPWVIPLFTKQGYEKHRERGLEQLPPSLSGLYLFGLVDSCPGLHSLNPVPSLSGLLPSRRISA